MPKFYTTEEEIAHNIRSNKSNLFATQDTIDQVIKNFDICGKDLIAFMVGVNTTLETIAKGVDAGDYTNRE